MSAAVVDRDAIGPEATGEVVLAGTSLTPDSDAVLRVAAALAGALGARLHVAHFLPSPELPLGHPELSPGLALPPAGARERDAVERLKEQLERTGLAGGGGAGVEIAGVEIAGTTVAEGPAHRLLSRMAEELDASLVVVGAREKEGPAARLLGSTADRVVRAGVAPVLVVRGEPRLPPSALVTVDLSPASLQAFSAGLRWLGRLGATDVTALFVVSPFQARVGETEVDYDTAVAAARDELARLCEQHATALPRPPRPLVLRGVPREHILDQARQLGVDLVVLGSHGRGGYQRFLLGSVSEEVLQRAERSVLVIPARPPAER